MNKRCTNSSCRKTFSTLSTLSTLGFDGRCPFCGKAYPQLAPSGEKGPQLRITVRRKAGGSGCWRSFRPPLEEALALGRDGQNGKAAAALRKAFGREGFFIDAEESRRFITDLMENRPPCAAWRLTGEKAYGLKVLVPIRGGGRYPAPRTEKTPVGPLRVFKGKRLKAFLEQPLDALDLAVRSFLCLRRAGIATLGDLVRLYGNEEEWTALSRLGKKSRAEITEKLSSLGIRTRPE